MKPCPDTDAILIVAGALDWDIDDGLRHPQTCDDCRATVDALLATRTALAADVPLGEAATVRIVGTLRAEAHDERTRAESRQRRWTVIEAALAGLSAPVALLSSGIRIDSAAAGLLCVALGALCVLSRRVVRWSV